MSRMPSLFVSHGGPNVVTDPSDARDFLMSLETVTGKPDAIIVASAHFEHAGPAVVTDPAPGMIYDFGGFAPELYDMVYAAPGDPALANRVIGQLSQAGYKPQPLDERGYDHGTWNPLILGYPEADIPVVQVSVDPGKDAAWHFAAGRALANLRDENILIIGSGHITHNLRAVFGAMRHGIATDPAMAGKVDAFIGWMRETLESGDKDRLVNWATEAPFVKDNHPTDEHLMPLFFAAGAGGEGAKAKRVHDSRQYGFFAWDSWLFD